MKNLSAKITIVAATVVLFGLPACGGSGGSGNMSLSVGDAPVDGAKKVVVESRGWNSFRTAGTPSRSPLQRQRE